MKLKEYIYTENDVITLQNELEKLYNWGDTNNCVFNELKFMCLKYGKNRELSNNTLYFTPNMNTVVEEVSYCRDLGIQIQNDGTFDIHIDNVVKKAKKRTRALLLNQWIKTQVINSFIKSIYI